MLIKCHSFLVQEMFNNLGDLLCSITGFDSFSLQPNAGAAGEYAGLMVIRAYHMVYKSFMQNVLMLGPRICFLALSIVGKP